MHTEALTYMTESTIIRKMLKPTDSGTDFYFLEISIFLEILRVWDTYKHIRSTPCASRGLFLRPAVCTWTPWSDLSGTERPISSHFPGCDFGSIILGRARCIRTHSAAILMTRGPYFKTHELLFGSFLGLRARPVEPVGHFGSLSGKRVKN